VGSREATRQLVRPRVEEFANSFQDSHRTLSPRSLNRKIVSSSSPDFILSLVCDHKSTLTPINVVSSFHKLAKLCAQPPSEDFTESFETDYDEGWAILSRKILEIIPELDAQGISNLVWALVKLRHSDRKDVLLRIQEPAAGMIDSFNGQNIANTLWAFATLGEEPSDIFLNALLQKIKRSASDFKPQSLANILWALAKLGLRTKESISAVEVLIDATSQQIRELKMQEICNCLWAITTLRGSKDSQRLSYFLKDAEDILRENSKKLNPKDLDHALRAFGILRHPVSAESLVAFESRAERLIPGIHRSQSLAHLLYNFARLSYVPSNTFADSLSECLDNMKPPSPGDIGSLYWSTAAAFWGKRGNEVGGSPSESSESPLKIVRALEDLTELSGLGNGGNVVSRVAWGYGKMHIQPRNTVKAMILETICQNSQDFSPAEVSRSLWALGELSADGGFTDARPAVQALLSRTEELYDKFLVENIVDLLKGIVRLSDICEPSTVLLEKLEYAAIHNPSKSSHKVLQNILFRFAQLEWYPSKEFFTCLLSSVEPESLSPRQTVDLLWAIAKLDLGDAETFASEILGDSNEIHDLHQKFLDKLLAHSSQLYAHFLPRDIPDVLSAMARLQHTPSLEALEGFEERIKSDAFKYSASEVSTVLWAVAKLNIDMSPETLNLIQSRASNITWQFSPEMAKIMMWSFARLDADPDHRLAAGLARCIAPR